MSHYSKSERKTKMDGRKEGKKELREGGKQTRTKAGGREVRREEEKKWLT